jgi:nitrogen regulatory protein PII 2
VIKEVVAVIRSGKFPETLVRLEAVGINGFSRQRVYGRGKQRGLRYSGKDGDGQGIGFLPKWMVTVVVEDARVAPVVEALTAANRTGEIGDGKVFICPVNECVRVRTNESGEQALA